MRLTSRRVAVCDLNDNDRAQMFRLFERYYACANRARFEEDLARKQWVIQLYDSKTGKLSGFSTQVLVTMWHEQQRVSAVFSGDTIIDPSCWGETALMREWGRLIVELVDATSPDPLYWFLISKGYKTYRFLPIFFREFYPRYDCATPAWATNLLDALGPCVLGNAYDAARRVCVASPSKDRLRAGVADITSQRLRDPHIRFFLQSNPGHIDGDELCCLARLDIANFTRAAIRLLDHEPQLLHEANERYVGEAR